MEWGGCFSIKDFSFTFLRLLFEPSFAVWGLVAEDKQPYRRGSEDGEDPINEIGYS